eukprot:sb/3479194/
MSRPNPNPNPSPNPNPTRALTLKNFFQHWRKHPDFNVFHIIIWVLKSAALLIGLAVLPNLGALQRLYYRFALPIEYTKTDFFQTAKATQPHGQFE